MSGDGHTRGRTGADPQHADSGSSDRDARRARLASLQHRLRTPANAIVGYTRLLMDEAPEAYQQTLDRLRVAGEDLERRIGELVIVERMEGAHIDRDFDDFLAALRRELATPMHVILGFCDITLRAMRADGSALQADVRRIVEATRRLLQVVERGGLEPPESLPAAWRTRPAELPSTESSPARWQPPKDCTVLVVDDQELNRTLLSRNLEQKGFNVLMAVNGLEALAVLRALAVDLVLLDLVMPELDGIGVLEAMRAEDALRDVPVIVISALDELDSIVRCIELGAQEYLPKTFNPTLFDARVRAVLERKRLHDQARVYMQELRVERERSDRLLTDILPAQVAERMKLGETTIADRFECVTVAFLDIVGFTAWSASTSANDLVSRLNDLFLAFDDIAKDHGVEKLKTMGDSYMMVSGVPRPRRDHAEAAVRACMAMLDALDAHNVRFDRKLEVRCGAHSGPVVAGVIGRSRFAYDVWGDTVNVASRMESQGVPGRIQVSADTAALLPDRFGRESRGRIEVRGRGEMETFLLARHRAGGSGGAQAR